MMDFFHRSHIYTLIFIFMTSTAFAAKTQPSQKIAYTEPITGMEFVLIPSGTFIMGNNQDINDKPEHQVTVKTFLFGRYEVTFEQYSKFCDATGRHLPSANGWGIEKRPVINVTKQDAIDFTKWLSGKTGRTFRLPSEAEWEYAAHGGTKFRFPWGNELGKNLANCRNCGSKWDNLMTAPVGSFAPNGYGLYDMIGNVYEWCLDGWHKDYIGAPNDGSAWLTEDESGDQINRGGSWYRPESEMPISRRCWDKADTRDNEHGFRVVMEK